MIPPQKITWGVKQTFLFILKQRGLSFFHCFGFGEKKSVLVWTEPLFLSSLVLNRKSILRSALGSRNLYFTQQEDLWNKCWGCFGLPTCSLIVQMPEWWAIPETDGVQTDKLLHPYISRGDENFSHSKIPVRKCGFVEIKISHSTMSILMKIFNFLIRWIKTKPVVWNHLFEMKLHFLFQNKKKVRVRYQIVSYRWKISTFSIPIFAIWNFPAQHFDFLFLFWAESHFKMLKFPMKGQSHSPPPPPNSSIYESFGLVRSQENNTKQLPSAFILQTKRHLLARSLAANQWLHGIHLHNRKCV